MPRVTVAECQAWVEGTKFTIPGPLFVAQDEELVEQIEEEIIARVSSAYDTSTWLNELSTPRLIRVAICKKFTSWAYRRQYSESITEEDAAYAMLLEANSETIVQGVVDGSIEIPGVPGAGGGQPSFYPTDASSALEPTRDDPSLGPAKFSMGMQF